MLANNLVVVVILGCGPIKHLAGQRQGVHRLQAGVIVARVQLLHISLAGRKQNALLKAGAPQHLHLDNEGATPRIFALDIDNGVFEQTRQLGHLLGRQVLQAFNLAIVGQGQQGVQKTAQQVLMLTKHAFESEVHFGVEVAGGHGR